MGIRIEIDSDVLLELIRTKQAEVLEEFADDVDDAIDEAYEDGFAWGQSYALENLDRALSDYMVPEEAVVEVDFESFADEDGFYEVEPYRDPQENAQIEGFHYDEVPVTEVYLYSEPQPDTWSNEKSEDPFENRQEDAPRQGKSGTWVRNPDGTGGMVGGNGS